MEFLLCILLNYEEKRKIENLLNVVAETILRPLLAAAGGGGVISLGRLHFGKGKKLT